MTEWNELSAIRAELDALSCPTAIGTKETSPNTTFVQRTPRDTTSPHAAPSRPNSQPLIDVRGIINEVIAQVRQELRAEFTRVHEQLGADLRHEIASQVRAMVVQYWPVTGGLGHSGDTEADGAHITGPSSATHATTTLADAIDQRVHAAVEAILASNSTALTAALEHKLIAKQTDLVESQLRTMLQEHELAQTRALAGHRSEASHAVARCMSAVDQLRDALHEERGQRLAAQAEAKAAMHAELQPFMQRQQAAMRAEQAARAQSEHRLEQLSAKLSERLQELPSLAMKATRTLHLGDVDGDSHSSATNIGGLLGSLRQRLSDVAAQAAAAVEVASTLAARLPAVERDAAAAAQSASDVSASIQDLRVEQRLQTLSQAHKEIQHVLRHVSTALVGQEDTSLGRRSELATLAAAVRDGSVVSLNSRLSQADKVHADNTAAVTLATQKCVLHAKKTAQFAAMASTFCSKAEGSASAARLSCTQLSEVAAKTVQARQQLEEGLKRSITQLRVMLDEEHSRSDEATSATESNALFHRLHDVENLQTQIMQTATVAQHAQATASEALQLAQNVHAEASAKRTQTEQVTRQRSLAELAIPILRDVASDATAQAARFVSSHKARSFAIPVLESQIQALEQALERQTNSKQESPQYNRRSNWAKAIDAWSSDSDMQSDRDTDTRTGEHAHGESRLSDCDSSDSDNNETSPSRVLAVTSGARGQNDGTFV